ncbi:DNA recombination protein RmuC [Aestuariimicrobium ganziense]|uniref:DNA recombination protein RmuC n=1 Tax=Aestuariimicrobium ganziense TaxID=2773677 RepID=UPI001940C6AD|nr:DNA recombination protein RmuC [Aestuariimicrobium ganziense]
MELLTVMALLFGLLVGGGVGWVLARSRQSTEGAHAQTAIAEARGEAERARGETERARAELAGVRQRDAEAQSLVAEAREDAAHARGEAALALAEAARVQAEVAKAVAEREAAVLRAEELAADRESLVTQFKALSAESLEAQGKRADASAEARLKATEQLMAPVQESLRLFNERLTEVEKERVEIAAELRQQVKNVQFTGENLRRETQSLVTALRKPQVRGAWGEIQLKRVAEIAGMVDRCDFDLQLTAQTDERTLRPDMRVNLADGKFLYVDSKVPLSAFLDAHGTEDDRERDQFLAQFGKNVRTHIDQLSAKQYWKLEATSPEFVIMFLPNESFLAAALEQHADLYDYAAKRDIIIATPTTLIATLRTAAYAWKQAALAESAAQVFTLGRELYERLGKMGSDFDKVGRALTSAVKSYNSTVGSLEGRVLVSARRFRDLKVTEAELAEVSPSQESVRQLTAPELVEHAQEVEMLVGRERRSEQLELTRGEPSTEELVDQSQPALLDDRRRRNAT